MELLTAILKKIEHYQTIIIHRHVRPDPDAFGSQVGLAKFIQANFPDKAVYCTGEDESSLNFLAKMDQVDDRTFTEALAIVCDTANRPRIDDTRYQSAQEVIKIDHHPEVDVYGNISWVDTNASSTSEMIFQFIDYSRNQGLDLTDEVARLLYAGIVGDTGRFLYPSTTEQTFHIAAQLIQYQFDRTQLYHDMYRISIPIARLKGYLLEQLNVSESGVCAVKLSKDILERYQVTPDQTSMLVGLYGDIEGIKCWAMFVEDEESIRVRLRSKGPVINQVAARYNGGGHPLASGATVYSWEEADQLIDALEELVN
ncbi:DHH family phosphoesterase [Amphibacillus sediminis]|uniref:DHH family phosphoesterase n=1 Tax=Amphibacillus sediminis TaxID=360185 RepID=UPI0008301D25|nr:bifunctional oligoribonuclease/PAP phosphatase NrnA [Amphibacillus sediminis]